MAGEWLLATQFAAAFGVLAIALALCYLDFKSRAVRAFAAFLVVRSAISLVLAWRAVSEGTNGAQLAATVEYYNLAAPFLLAYFIGVYPRPDGRPAARGLLLVLAPAGALTLVAYAVDHCNFFCQGPGGLLQLGPLGALSFSLPLVESAGAAYLLREAGRVPESERHSRRLVATGLMLDAMTNATLYLGAIAAAPTSIGFGGAGAWIVPGMPLLAVGIGAYSARSWSVDAPWVGRLVASVALLNFLIGALLLSQIPNLAFGLVGLSRFMLPAVVATALIRHRLFGIDLRTRRIASHATLGAFFAAVFFVVSESVATVLGPRVGTFAGIGAAGVLLFALAPIQHAAHRVIQATVGPPPPKDGPAFYREMARRAWRDGQLTREERRFLDELRARLGISFEEAAGIETEVASLSPMETRP